MYFSRNIIIQKRNIKGSAQKQSLNHSASPNTVVKRKSNRTQRVSSVGPATGPPSSDRQTKRPDAGSSSQVSVLCPCWCCIDVCLRVGVKSACEICVLNEVVVALVPQNAARLDERSRGERQYYEWFREGGSIVGLWMGYMNYERMLGG